MRWEEIDIVRRRKECIDHFLTGDCSFKGLCISYGISRKTGYKWVGRFKSSQVKSSQEVQQPDR